MRRTLTALGWPAAAAVLVCGTAYLACAGEVELPDAAPTGDGVSGLPTKPGSPCVAAKCGPNLICMANVCRSTCTTECGDTAPECAADEGCYWETSFSAVCLPGTAGLGEACGEGNGVICKPKLICVSWAGKAAKCMGLCKYGCTGGTSCGETANGCKVCAP